MVMAIVVCVVAGVWAWSIADVVATDFGYEAQGKALWIAVVMVVPVVGGLAWLLRERPMQRRSAVGDLQARPYCRVIVPGSATPPSSRGNAWRVDE